MKFVLVAEKLNIPVGSNLYHPKLNHTLLSGPDIDALENNLSKEMSKDVIDKSYTITDINRLIIYLKSCGVDPKVFKSFINVTKTVDEKKLDKLADLGLIRKEQLEGCYTLKRKKPYFTVKMKRGKHDEEPKETKAVTAENEE